MPFECFEFGRQTEQNPLPKARWISEEQAAAGHPKKTNILASIFESTNLFIR